MRISRDEYLNQLIQRKHSPYIKIVTGVRRCGKSYLLKTLFRDHLLAEGVRDEQIVVVGLDDDKFEGQRDRKALREYVEAKAPDEGTRYYVILDEIQMVEAFEGAVISLNNHANYDVYITGSNSKFLSKDISTRFKDRGTEIRVHPLSYREFYGALRGRQALRAAGVPRFWRHAPPVRRARRGVEDALPGKPHRADVPERRRGAQRRAAPRGNGRALRRALLDHGARS